MILTSYHNSSTNNTINKTLQELGTIELSMFNGFNTMNSYIDLSKNALPQGTNYLKIDGLYYFVNQIDNGTFNYTRYYIQLDTLESYKDVILASKALRIQSNSSTMVQNINHDYSYTENNYLINTLGTDRSYILVTLGG